MVSLEENRTFRFARSRRVWNDPEMPARTLALQARVSGPLLKANTYLAFPFLLLMSMFVLYLAWMDISWCQDHGRPM